MMWLIIAHLKSNDNVAHHRTMDGTNDRLEFFVPESMEETFLQFLHAYKEAGLIISFKKEANR